MKLPESTVNVCAVAPPGAGKSTGLVIPFLLTNPESAVVLDFKGELSAASAEARRKMGHEVIVLAPFAGAGAGLNPLDLIPKDDPLALDFVTALAEALVVQNERSDGTATHFAETAQLAITAMTAVTVAYATPETRHLGQVRELLTNPEAFEAAIKLLCLSDDWGGMLRRLGGQMRHLQDKEKSSTLTTAGRHLRFLDSIAIANCTKASSFTPDLTGKRQTIFLVVPPEFQRTCAGLLRVWLVTLMRSVLRGGLQEKNKVHFVCDETAALGKLQALQDMLAIGRGYGIRVQMYFQSMGQLKLSFPDGQEQTALSNTTQIFFGVNDNETAEFVSKRLGEETVVVESGGTSGGTNSSRSVGSQYSESGGRSSNNSENWSLVGRSLLKPEEVLTQPRDHAISLIPGMPPVVTKLVKCYSEPCLNGKPTGFTTKLMAFGAAMTMFGLTGLLALAFTLRAIAGTR